MSSILRQHATPVLLMPLLVAGLFYKLLLHPTWGFYGEVNDLPALNMPLKYFLAKSYQETGALPLWNPHVCAGMPFIHDSQTAAFYPLHVILYVLPPEYMGATLSWLTVLHILLAGWCMYAYALTQGLSRLSSFTAGVGYMFAGKWLLHLITAGHYPMVGLAWVPLILLTLDKAIRQASLAWAVTGGAIFGILILGSHPQVIFYTGLFTALWTLGPALESAGLLNGSRIRSLPWALAVWAGMGVVAVAVACLIGAVQLLPNLEIVPHASRSLGMESGESLLLTFWKTLQLIGPPMGDPFWENQGGLGVIWVATAVMGLVVGDKRKWFYALAALLVIAYGVGGSALLQPLPGFNLFRCPGRMLWFSVIPVVLLVGQGMDATIFHKAVSERTMAMLRAFLLAWVVVALAALGLLSARDRLVGSSTTVLQIYWPGSVIALGVLAYLLLRFGLPSRLPSAFLYAGILIADLILIIYPFIDVRDYREVLVSSACVEYVKENAADGSRVLDRDYVDKKGKVFMGSGPVGLTLPLVTGLEPVRGWHSIDVLRYKEYLAFIADRNSPFGQKDVVINFAIINKPLLDALAVRYVVQPSNAEFVVGAEKAVASHPEFAAVYTDPNPIGSYNVMSFPRIKELPPYTVYENKTVMPRAWLVGHAVPAPERKGMLKALKETDLRKTVLIEGLASPEDTGLRVQDCVCVLRQPNRLVYRVRCDKPAFLVFSEIWFPGWRCFVGEQEVPIYRANYTFRAIRVPQGEHEIRMVMDPASLRWGKWISISTTVVLGVLALFQCGWWLYRRRLAKEATEAAA